ncbi:transposase [Bifidobacterium subtile]|uniref:transposase n=1 Tax=Bifidobacterium subtile TaxID=77635 RepID=UPI0004660C80
MDHHGDPDRVAPVACDMSPGFAKGIREHLPNAAKVIDKVHVVRHANGAVDKVRKTQATAGKRYVTISNPTLAHRRFPNISR